MWDNADELKDMLKHLEGLKVGIMREINRLNANEESIRPTTVYPMAKVKPTIINNFPVFQFSYEGMLPHDKQDDRNYLAMIRHYYFRATFDSYDFEKITFRFDEAVIVFVQYFKNNIIRDLENRNKKFIQDAIRMTGIIRDDNWKNVWNMDIGLADNEKDHVQVYVVSRTNFADFYNFLLKNHEDMKNFDCFAINKEEAFKEYKENKKRKELELKKEEKKQFEGLF